MTTERRIQAFAIASGKLPQLLSDLPSEGPNWDDDLHDGWGRTIIYVREDDRTARLFSFGASGIEGEPGGYIDEFRVEARSGTMPSSEPSRLSITPPTGLPEARLLSIERQIRSFAQENGRLPRKLSELPLEGPDFFDAIHDV